MKLAAALLLTAGLAACAATPPREPVPLPPAPASGAGLASGDCFRTQDMRNHEIADASTLLVRVNRGQVYRVTMSGACLTGAMPGDPLIIRQPPGSSIVCRPLDLDIGVSKAGFESRCIVQSIDKLTPEQVEALPKRVRP